MCSEYTTRKTQNNEDATRIQPINNIKERTNREEAGTSRAASRTEEEQIESTKKER